MRVLFLTGMHPTHAHPQPMRGIIVRRLSAALAARGHDIITCEMGLGSGAGRYIRTRRDVAHTIREQHPAVIHVHFGYSGLALPRTGVPVVTSFYGDDLLGTHNAGGNLSWKSRMGLLVSQVTAWRSAACIVISEGMRQQLWLRNVQRRTVVVRDAVDPALFHPIQRSDARRRLGIDERDDLVLFPNNPAYPNKRVWLAQAAVDQLRARRPHARLWIVSDCPPDEMPWYYAAADVMVVTSITEGGPSSAKEALACGLPVVSVPVGDTQLFLDSPAAVFPAAASAPELAEALERAMVFSRAQERRSHLPPQLTLANAAQRIEGIYQSVAGRTPVA